MLQCVACASLLSLTVFVSSVHYLLTKGVPQLLGSFPDSEDPSKSGLPEDKGQISSWHSGNKHLETYVIEKVRPSILRCNFRKSGNYQRLMVIHWKVFYLLSNCNNMWFLCSFLLLCNIFFLQSNRRHQVLNFPKMSVWHKSFKIRLLNWNDTFPATYCI